MALKVYRVNEDVDRFQTLMPDGRAAEKAWDGFVDRLDRCEDLGDDWAPPKKFYIDSPKRPVPDFWSVALANGVLVASERAADLVGDLMEEAGELLAMPWKGEDLAVLNITLCVNCLNGKESTGLRSGGVLWDIHKHVFHADRFEEGSLFKVPEQTSSIYCIERFGDPETEFKAAVEHHKLTGLRFEEVWAAPERKGAAARSRATGKKGATSRTSAGGETHRGRRRTKG